MIREGRWRVNWKQGALALAVGAVLLGAGFWVGSVRAAGNEPGSEADPLVTKSYVDSRTAFQVVNVPKGQSLIGEGGTEIVLRGGKVTAIVSPQGGLLDVTGAADLVQGEQLKPQHLVIIPRTDGRGVQAQMDAVLMVRGAFTLKAAGQ